MVALFDLEFEQLDVETTFLHGDLKERHAPARGLYGQRQGKLYMQAEEVVARVEAVTKEAVQVI